MNRSLALGIALSLFGGFAWSATPTTIFDSTGAFSWLINSSGIGPVADAVLDSASSQPIPAGTNIVGKFGIDQTTAGTTNGVSLSQVGATTISTGTGAQGAGTPRVTVAVDSATVAGSATLPAGANLVGKVGIDQTTPGSTNAMTPVAAAIGGATPYGLQSAATTNSTNVKASAGSLLAVNLINTTTTIYYLRTYDSATAPTCSSATNFVRTWPVPPGASSGLAGGIAASLPVSGTAFTNGISFCLTGGPTSTDNTNAATGVFVNLDYK